MTPAADDSRETREIILERDVRLSESLVWGRQRDAYVQRGLRSWTEDMVPHFITNNPFFADLHARIAFGFLCDCVEFRKLNTDSASPVKHLSVLELGGGPGKFSFLFLRHLEMLLRTRNIPLETVRYCLTDCSESLLQSWRANPQLSQFTERNILEFEIFDASENTGIQFLAGDEKSRDPLIVIANYFLDSLPQDAYRIKEGEVFEYLQTTKRTVQGSTDAGPEDLQQLHFSYTNVAVPAGRYEESSWNNILDSYRSRFPNATVLFPSGALKLLRNICESTRGPMLVLASDKGFVHEDDLALSKGPPSFEFHAPNVFSQMVNFHAVAKYFTELGGQAWLPSKHSLNMNVCAFMKNLEGGAFPAIAAACGDMQGAFGPDDLFALLAWLNPHIEAMSVPQISAILRLSRWDPATLMRVFPVLARQIRSVSTEREDLRSAVLLTWSNHFPLAKDDNALAFYCAVLLLELRFFDEAASLFKQSQDLLGHSAATSYNLGLCSSGLGRANEALAHMTEACRLDPTFESAQLALRKLHEGVINSPGV